jgi:hypothetical protein
MNAYNIMTQGHYIIDTDDEPKVFENERTGTDEPKKFSLKAIFRD